MRWLIGLVKYAVRNIRRVGGRLGKKGTGWDAHRTSGGGGAAKGPAYKTEVSSYGGTTLSSSTSIFRVEGTDGGADPEDGMGVPVRDPRSGGPRRPTPVQHSMACRHEEHEADKDSGWVVLDDRSDRVLVR